MTLSDPVQGFLANPLLPKHGPLIIVDFGIFTLIHPELQAPSQKSATTSTRQCGSNENTNGVLRQYFPKGMDLSGIHQNKLHAVARQLNERPLKTSNYETPEERLNQRVASIG